MSTFDNLLAERYLPYLVGGGVVAATAVVLLYMRSRKEEDHLVEAPKDTLVLHMIPRGPYTPNLSPFPLKLETYLRMTKVPFMNVFSMKMSPKTKKTPWAQFNGEILTDSHLIIDHVNKHFKIDTMSNLSPNDRAVARAFQRMSEEATYWCAARWRWELDSPKFLVEECKIPAFIVKIVQHNIKQQCYQQGIGRLQPEEMLNMFKRDVKAVSVYLGDKKFLMGKDPCEVDCCLFGLLAQVKWHAPRSPILEIMNEFPNLHAYCERMKETFWPDWNECITHGGTKEATK